MTNLNIKFACLSNIIKLLLPFNYPTNVDTPIFGEKRCDTYNAILYVCNCFCQITCLYWLTGLKMHLLQAFSVLVNLVEVGLRIHNEYCPAIFFI